MKKIILKKNSDYKNFSEKFSRISLLIEISAVFLLIFKMMINMKSPDFVSIICRFFTTPVDNKNLNVILSGWIELTDDPVFVIKILIFGSYW